MTLRMVVPAMVTLAALTCGLAAIQAGLDQANAAFWRGTVVPLAERAAHETVERLRRVRARHARMLGAVSHLLPLEEHRHHRARRAVLAGVIELVVEAHAAKGRAVAQRGRLQAHVAFARVEHLRLDCASEARPWNSPSILITPPPHPWTNAY